MRNISFKKTDNYAKVSDIINMEFSSLVYASYELIVTQPHTV